MSRFALSALLLSGCFYTDPINQRPSIDITAPGTETYRGDHVELTAVSNDPDGDYVTYKWRAYACTDGVGGADCDAEPFTTGINPGFPVDIPLVRDNGLPVRNVRVVLGAKDEYGATAKPEQEHVIVTLDRPPVVQVARTESFVMTAHRKTVIYASVSDLDDGPDAVGTPVWEVFAPTGGTGLLVDPTPTSGSPHPERLVDPAHPERVTWVKEFTPDLIGAWEVRVTASDPLDSMASGSVMMQVVPPPPPCIAQVAPIVAPVGLALPVSDPTLFKVGVVSDDLDVWPPQGADLGVTRFQWSFMGPGGSTHAPVAGATGNSFALDPATFTPGDIVEVRVEIYDRESTPIVCPDGDATCSTVSMPSCIQRQTWRVEVR